MNVIARCDRCDRCLELGEVYYENLSARRTVGGERPMYAAKETVCEACDHATEGAVALLEQIAADLEGELAVGGQTPTVFPSEIRAFLVGGQS